MEGFGWGWDAAVPIQGCVTHWTRLHCCTAGIVDVRYVAVLDYQKSSQRVARRRCSAASRGAPYSSASCSSSGSDSDEEERLNRRDSVARGSDARAVGAHNTLRPTGPRIRLLLG
jgi:hypothetical protein